MTLIADCIFCRIIRGEIPSFQVFDNERTLAFMDINPANPGHVLVIPKVHAESISPSRSHSCGRRCQSCRELHERSTRCSSLMA